MSSLLRHDVLVVDQKAKLFELTSEYTIRDAEGNEIGAIRQEGQSAARKFLRAVTSVDQFLTHRLSVYDRDGAKVIELTRPRKVLKSTVIVADDGGREVGRMAQENVVGKKRFSLLGSSGERLGAINAENWRAWDFAIEDATGVEVGRITKQWKGLLREGFTTADKYLLSVSGQVSPDLRLMMLAAAAGVDLALKQDEGGSGIG